MKYINKLVLNKNFNSTFTVAARMSELYFWAKEPLYISSGRKSSVFQSFIVKNNRNKETSVFCLRTIVYQPSTVTQESHDALFVHYLVSSENAIYTVSTEILKNKKVAKIV